MLRPATIRTAATLGAAVALAVGLAACSSSGGGSAAGQDSAPATSPVSSTVAATTSVPASRNTALINVTGPISVHAQGPGGECAYYYPGQHKGYSYTARSTEFPSGTSSVGGWDLSVQNDTGNNMLIYFNTHTGSWTGGRTITGTVHADPHLHHVDFDVQLTKVIGQQHAHLTGSIDCP